MKSLLNWMEKVCHFLCNKISLTTKSGKSEDHKQNNCISNELKVTIDDNGTVRINTHNKDVRNSFEQTKKILSTYNK